MIVFNPPHHFVSLPLLTPYFPQLIISFISFFFKEKKHAKCFAYMYVWASYACLVWPETEEGMGSPEAGAMGGCELPCGRHLSSPSCFLVLRHGLTGQPWLTCHRFSAGNRSHCYSLQPCHVCSFQHSSRPPTPSLTIILPALFLDIPLS